MASMIKQEEESRKNLREGQKFFNKRQMKGLDKLKFIEELLSDIVCRIRDDSYLDEDKLRICLSLTVSLTLQEAFNVQLCPYFSYISYLIRHKGINARVMLKDMSDIINKFEDMVFNSVEKQVEVYRLMEYQDGSEDSSSIGQKQSTVQEIRGQKIKVQQLITRQIGNSNPIVFERRIKNS